LWKCNKCGNLIGNEFYYIEQCKYKFCKTCKNAMIKEESFKCLCTETHKQKPTKIILREYSEGSSDKSDSEEISDSNIDD